MLTLPFGLWTATLLVGMAGLWNASHSWNRAVATQLAIDRCAARAAIDLRDHLSAIDSSNGRIVSLRSALLVAVEPSTRAGLQAALVTVSAHQDLTFAAWQGRRARWLLPGSCPGAGSGLSLNPLPPSPWVRRPPDPLGPLPSVWSHPVPPAAAEFRVARRSPPRSTRAFVRRASYEGATWIAAWRPRRPGPD